MQFMQPQQQNNFSGWNDRLTKIEEGIASLTDQFKNFQNPGNEPLPITDVTPPALDDTPGFSFPGMNNTEIGTGPLDSVAKIDDPLRFNQVTAPGHIPDRYKEGYVDFYKQNPDDFMRMGGQAISYVTTPQGERIQFGDTGSADNFRRYLESIGENPIPDQFSPLSQQGLPMGQHPLMGLNFRQEGDMGRWVADNDPGGIAAGYSNLQDYLAAGNQLPNQQQFNPNQGIASLADYQTQNTGPGV